MQRTQALRERTSALRTARTRRLGLSFALSTVTPLGLRAACNSTPRILTTRRPLLRCALGLGPCSTRPLLRSSARASRTASRNGCSGAFWLRPLPFSPTPVSCLRLLSWAGLGCGPLLPRSCRTGPSGRCTFCPLSLLFLRLLKLLPLKKLTFTLRGLLFLRLTGS